MLCFSWTADKPDEIHQVEADAEGGGEGRCKSDIRQRCVRLIAHDPGNRQTDEESLRKALQHHPQRLLMAIEIPRQLLTTLKGRSLRLAPEVLT